MTASVIRRGDEYIVIDEGGWEIESFRVGSDGPADLCAAEAHLLARAVSDSAG